MWEGKWGGLQRHRVVSTYMGFGSDRRLPFVAGFSSGGSVEATPASFAIMGMICSGREVSPAWIMPCGRSNNQKRPNVYF